MGEPMHELIKLFNPHLLQQIADACWRAVNASAQGPDQQVTLVFRKGALRYVNGTNNQSAATDDDGEVLDADYTRHTK